MTDQEFAKVVSTLESGLLKRLPEEWARGWVELVRSKDGAPMQAAAEKLATDPERRAVGWPAVGELLRYYDSEVKARHAKVEQQDFSRSEASTLHGTLSRTLAETLRDNPWQPTNQAERDAAFFFRESLHDAHGVRKSPNPHVRIAPIKTEPAWMRTLEQLGGYPWLRSLQSHDVLMARELFCRKATA